MPRLRDKIWREASNEALLRPPDAIVRFARSIIRGSGMSDAARLHMITATNSPSRPFTVVVGIDFSPDSHRALATARTLCTLTGGGRLHAVHAVSLVDLASEMATSPITGSEIESEQIASARARLAALVQLEALPAGSELALHVETGIAHEVITQVARDCGADLVVVGTRGLNGIRRLLNGSVSGQVTRNAPCSVVTVRARETTAAEMVEPGCPECIAATTANGGVYIRCTRHQARGVRPHTYTDLGYALGGPVNSFSF